MRYIVFEVPFLLKKAISTEFRLIAFIIAVFRRLAGKDVYVYDIEDGEFIINWGSAHPGQDMNNLKYFYYCVECAKHFGCQGTDHHQTWCSGCDKYGNCLSRILVHNTNNISHGICKDCFNKINVHQNHSVI
jgi:hypothetical protein